MKTFTLADKPSEGLASHLWDCTSLVKDPVLKEAGLTVEAPSDILPGSGQDCLKEFNARASFYVQFCLIWLTTTSDICLDLSYASIIDVDAETHHPDRTAGDKSILIGNTAGRLLLLCPVKGTFIYDTVKKLHWIQPAAGVLVEEPGLKTRIKTRNSRLRIKTGNTVILPPRRLLPHGKDQPDDVTVPGGQIGTYAI